MERAVFFRQTDDLWHMAIVCELNEISFAAATASARLINFFPPWFILSLPLVLSLSHSKKSNRYFYSFDQSEPGMRQPIDQLLGPRKIN